MLREKQNTSQTFNDFLLESKRKIHNPGAKALKSKVVGSRKSPKDDRQDTLYELSEQSSYTW